MNASDVRERWANRSGEYSPGYYAYYGPNETSELLRTIFDRVVEPTAAVLELGCSSGRHLAHLQDHGYENLHGIEINDEAMAVMADTYPDLASEGTFYVDAIENTVADFEDGQFDVVYSVETLQHLHPDDEWVFEELGRITGDRLVTVENEGETGLQQSPERDVKYVHDDFPLYFRNWNRIFTDRGFVEVEARSLDRDTLRVFRPPRD